MILKEFPEFRKNKIWKDYEKSDLFKESLLSLEMSEFSEFTVAALNNEIPFKNSVKIFHFIETLLLEGDQSVKDAAATCFLENLLNYASAGKLKTSSFIPFLGPESKAYCKAWDEFTGVKTPGLWDVE